MHIINQNPYRILGVPINSSERDIQKQITKCTRFSEVGKAISFDTDFKFLGELNRTSTSIEMASKAIEQPIDRLNNSLFWFWKNNHIDEAVFDNLSKNNIDKSIDILEKVVKDGDVSLKNYSCLFNLKSLLLALSIKEKKINEEFFFKGIQLSGKFFTHDGIKSFIKDIGGNNLNISVDDLELKYVSFVYELTKSFIGESESSNKSLKKSKVGDDGQTKISKDKFISSFSTFSKNAREYISQKFTSDHINKIEDQIETTTSLRKENPSEASVFGSTLVKNTKFNIDSLRNLLGESDLKYQMLANNLANEILQCGIDFFNHKNQNGIAVEKDGKIALKLCNQAKEIVCDGQVKLRLDESLEFINNWLKEAPDESQLEALKETKKIHDQMEASVKLITSKATDKFFTSAQNLIKISKVSLPIIEKIVGKEDKNYQELSDQVVQISMALLIGYWNQKIDLMMYFEMGQIDSLSGSLLKFYMKPETKKHYLKNSRVFSDSYYSRTNIHQYSGRSTGGGGCYIATMVYGDYSHPKVRILREFRDNFLSRYFIGRNFIKFYYKFSPAFVKYTKKSKLINKIIRSLLNKFINLIN